MEDMHQEEVIDFTLAFGAQEVVYLLVFIEPEGVVNARLVSNLIVL